MCSTNNNYNTSSDYSAGFDYAQWRRDVASELDHAGMVDEAELWRECQSGTSIWTAHDTPTLPEHVKRLVVCATEPSHHMKALHASCDLRACPDCAERESARLMHRYADHIIDQSRKAPKTYGLRHIVLTSPYSLQSVAPAEFRRFMGNVSLLFDLLASKNPNFRKWRQKQGVLAAAEFGESGYRLHVHIIHLGPYIPFALLRDCWEQVTGGVCLNVWVGGIRGPKQGVENKIIEALKYSVKFFKRDSEGNVIALDPELVPQLLTVLKGSRRVRSYGLFYRLPEPIERESRCPVCGGETSLWGRADYEIWSHTGWGPAEACEALILKPANNFVSVTDGIRDGPPTPSTTDPPPVQLSYADIVDSWKNPFTT